MVIKTALSRVSSRLVVGGGGGAAARAGDRDGMIPTSEIKIKSAERGTGDGAAATFVSDMSTPHVDMAEQSEPSYDCVALKKKVNVTVTVLSIAGLCVRDVGKRGRLSLITRRKRLDSSPPPYKVVAGGIETDTSTLTTSTPDTLPPVTVVASFVRPVAAKEGKSKTVMTHLPSLPLPPMQANGKPVNSVIHWPEQDPEVRSVSDGDGGQGVSSYQFRRTFQREDASDPKSNGPRQSERFVPQPLNIQIALSRQGKMFRIGTASVLLSGEENGESSINVPIRNVNPAITPKGNKFFRNSSNAPVDGEKAIPMVKLKGDTLKCGLDPNATLRVLVHVSEPIGETLDLSPTLTVTMVSTAKAKDTKKGQGSLVPIPTLSSPTESQGSSLKCVPKPRDWPTTSEPPPTLPETPCEESPDKQGVFASVKSPDTNGNINAVAKDNTSESLEEYNTELATVLVRSPDTEGNINAVAEEGGICGVLSTLHDDGEEEDKAAEESDGADNDFGDDYDNDDDPSCTSSAYMSDAGHFGCRCRSSATNTTGSSSALSSVVSDLTDGNSWLSRTGVEVVPSSSMDGATDQAKAAAVDYALPPGSRLLDYLEGEEEERRRARRARGDTRDFTSTTVDDDTSYVTDGDERRRTFFPHRARGGKTWKQRLSCGVLPACGPSYRDVDDRERRYDADALSLVREEEEYASGPWRMVGRRDPLDARSSYCTDESLSTDASDSGSE